VPVVLNVFFFLIRIQKKLAVPGGLRGSLSPPRVPRGVLDVAGGLLVVARGVCPLF